MKKSIVLRLSAVFLALLLLAIVVVTCSVRTSRQISLSYPQTKSMPLVRKIAKLYIAQPKVALQMLDSAEHNRLIPIEEIQNLRALSYQYGLNDDNKAMECAHDGYAHAIECNDTIAQLSSLKVLLSLYYCQSHYTDVIVNANKALSLAEAVGDKESQAFFLMSLGCAKSEIDNIHDAIEYLNRSVEMYREVEADSGSFTTADNLLYTLTKQINVMSFNKFYEQAVALIPYCKASLERLKQVGDITIGLNDIREAQLMAACAEAYYGIGDKENAQQCYEKFVHTHYASSAEGVSLPVPYLVASGQYEEALRRINIRKQHERKHHSVVTYYYIRELLCNEFNCYLSLRMYRQAALSANENMVLADSLRAREKKDYVKEVKKVFADRDMQLQLARHEQQAESGQIVLVFSAIIMIVLGLLLAISIRYNRVLRRKDRANLAAMEELRKMHKERTRQHTATIEIDDADVADDDEHKMFVVVYNEIVTHKLYLKPGFSRDDALSIVPMSPKQFSALFQKYSTGFVSCINNLRLDHSLELIRSNHDYTIEGIALESGFSNRQTFHRLFVEKYGMTPTEYKRLLQIEK